MSAFDRAKEAAEEAVDRVKEEISELKHHDHKEGDEPAALDLIEDNRGAVEPDHYNS
jgi:hypothetical protein